MNKAWTYLSGIILNGQTPEQADAGALGRMIHEYPYFAGLQYLKALQSSVLGTPEAPVDRARAALYFPDVQWYRSLLEDAVTLTDQTPSPEETIMMETEPVKETEPQPTTVPIASAIPEEPVGVTQAELELQESEKGPVLAFEPLYTIDYFASQGIKFNPETGKDQLSLRMKSFTEWLKSMKRIHPERTEGQGDDEPAVREIAETSNQALDIHTEAMAEVYLKQGLREKAIETYRKLSLLDPSKSAYFAVRINEIKEN